MRKNAIVSPFTLMADFNCLVNFTRVNEFEAMCLKRSPVKVGNEPLSNFTFMCDLSCIGSILFTHKNSMRVRM